MTIKILTDSCCDLPIEYLKENADIIDLLGMPIHIDGEDFVDDLGENTDLSSFYDKLRDGKMASTSQITPLMFETAFRKNWEQGAQTIYLGLSSGLSGTMNNANLAKTMIEDEMPEAKIFVPNTVSASVGQGIQIVYAVNMIREGKSAEEIVVWLESNKLKTQHWFAVDNLEYLKNGGRISPAVAKIGTMLSVKPILRVDNEGKLKLYQNVRGRKKSIKYLAGKVEAFASDHPEMLVMIGHGDCIEDAKKLKSLIEENVDPSRVILSNLAHTIATHVGPDMLGVAFVAGQRED